MLRYIINMNTDKDGKCEKDEKCENDENCERNERNETDEINETYEPNIKFSISELTDLETDYLKCGIGTCTPSAMQVLANNKLYLVIYFVVGVVLGMFSTYSAAVTSTLEKRFELSSKQMGIIVAGNDVSQISLSVFIAYYGNYGNRPKLIGFGMICASVGSFLAYSPHLFYGPGEDSMALLQSDFTVSKIYSDNNTKNDDLCYSPLEKGCNVLPTTSSHFSYGPVVILFMAGLLVGVAVAIYSSLGLVYLDDNISKKNSSIYYGVSIVTKSLGPTFGFLLGAQCLSVFIHPHSNTTLSPRDPRWIGAWWLGFVILGIVMGVCAPLLFLFPRILPSTFYKIVNQNITEMSNGLKEMKGTSLQSHVHSLLYEKKQQSKPTIKKFPGAMKRLLTNKIWLGLNISTVFGMHAMLGYWNFMSKYMEYQFRKSARVANFYTGTGTLIASMSGITISALVIRIFKPGPRLVTGYSCCMKLVMVGSMIALMLIQCPTSNIVGLNSSSKDSCYEDCGCGQRYSPACSLEDSTVFHSPCYAGCTHADESATPKEYWNCKCVSPVAVNDSVMIEEKTKAPFTEVNGDFGIEVTEATGGKVVRGYCEENCDAFFYYVLVTVITNMIIKTKDVGNLLVYLRAVDIPDKGLALGVSSVLLSLLANVPAPIIMGAFLDSSCVIWEKSCEGRGNCWFYDPEKFRKYIHGIPAAILLFSGLGDVIAFQNSDELNLYAETTNGVGEI